MPDQEKGGPRNLDRPLSHYRSVTGAGSQTILHSIFVQNHSIDHHGVAFAHIVNVDRDTDLDACSHRVFIEGLTAFCDVSNRLSEFVSPRTAFFLKDNCLSRCVGGNSPSTFGRCRGRRCRGLRKGERRDKRNCEC